MLQISRRIHQGWEPLESLGKPYAKELCAYTTDREILNATQLSIITYWGQCPILGTQSQISESPRAPHCHIEHCIGLANYSIAWIDIDGLSKASSTVQRSPLTWNFKHRASVISVSKHQYSIEKRTTAIRARCKAFAKPLVLYYLQYR